MTDEVAELQGEELPETTGEGATEEESPPSDTQEDTPAEKPKAKGVQKRIDELTELRRSAEKDRDYWRQVALANQRKEEKPVDAPPEPAGRPKLDDYPSYDEYVEALADWKIEEKEKAAEKRRAEEAQRTTRVERETAFQRRVEKVVEQHPDWDDVVRSMPRLSQATYEAAMISEKGPEILYYLGQNPEEADQMFRLDPVQSALAIGRLEAKLSRPTRTTTGAPDPIEPVHGGGGNQSVDPDKLTPEQWLKWRNQQLNR